MFIFSFRLYTVCSSLQLLLRTIITYEHFSHPYPPPPTNLFTVGGGEGEGGGPCVCPPMCAALPLGLVSLCRPLSLLSAY